MIGKAKSVALLAGALVFAGGAGFLASKALGIGQQAPTVTTTLNVSNGEQGPPGPPGPAGSPGAESCPVGSTFKAVRINTPGGHVTLWTCVADE